MTRLSPRVAPPATFYHHWSRRFSTTPLLLFHMFLVDWFFGALGYLGKVFFKPVSPTCTTTIVAFRPSTVVCHQYRPRAQNKWVFSVPLGLFFHLLTFFIFHHDAAPPLCCPPPELTTNIAPPQVFTTRMHVFCFSG